MNGCMDRRLDGCEISGGVSVQVCVVHWLHRTLHELICMCTVCEWVVASASLNLALRETWQSSLATETDSALLRWTRTVCLQLPAGLPLLHVCTVALVILSRYESLQGTTVFTHCWHTDTHCPPCTHAHKYTFVIPLFICLPQTVSHAPSSTWNDSIRLQFVLSRSMSSFTPLIGRCLALPLYNVRGTLVFSSLQ